ATLVGTEKRFRRIRNTFIQMTCGGPVGSHLIHLNLLEELCLKQAKRQMELHSIFAVLPTAPAKPAGHIRENGGRIGEIAALDTPERNMPSRHTLSWAVGFWACSRRYLVDRANVEIWRRAAKAPRKPASTDNSRISALRGEADISQRLPENRDFISNLFAPSS